MLRLALPPGRLSRVCSVAGIFGTGFWLLTTVGAQEPAANGKAGTHDNTAAAAGDVEGLEGRVDELIKRLGTSRTRTEAAREIQRLDPAAAPLLIERLTKMRLSVARLYLSRAMGRMNSPHVCRLVADRLETEDRKNVRTMLERVLSTAGEVARPSIDRLAAHDQTAVRASGMRLVTTDQASTTSGTTSTVTPRTI